MSLYLYRMQVTGLDAAGVATVYHFADVGFTTSPTHPTIPNTFLDNRIDQALSFKRSMFGNGQTRGDVPIAYGTIVLNNPDGALDYLGAVGFDAQNVYIYRADLAAPDVETLIWSGNTESVTLTETSLTFTVREATYQFDIALQPVKFAGTNVLPAGMEGTASDVKGKPKPIWLGTVPNVSPPLVNSAQLIYQLSDVQITAGYTLTVYDARVPLTPGLSLTAAQLSAAPIRNNFYCNDLTNSYLKTQDPVSLAAVNHTLTTADAVYFVDGYPYPPYTGGLCPPLNTTTQYFVRVIDPVTLTVHPTAADATANTNKIAITQAKLSQYQEIVKGNTLPGNYDYSNTASGFYIRLGSKPYGVLTCDMSDPTTSTLAGAIGAITARVAARGFGTYTVVNTIGQAPYPAIANQQLGCFVQDDMKAYALIQRLCASLNASFAIYPTATTDYKLVLARIEPGTAETPLLSLAEGDPLIGSYRRAYPGDAERGTPPWRISLKYKRNYTVMTGAQTAGAAKSDIDFVAIEWRTQVVDNVPIKTQFPAAPEINFETLLADQGSASLQAGYFVGVSPALYSGIRDVVTLQLPLSVVLSDVTATTGALTLTGLSGLAMGKPVALALNRLTRTMYLIGYDVDLKAKTVQLTLWG